MREFKVDSHQRWKRREDKCICAPAKVLKRLYRVPAIAHYVPVLLRSRASRMKRIMLTNDMTLNLLCDAEHDSMARRRRSFES